MKLNCVSTFLGKGHIEIFTLQRYEEMRDL